MLKNLFGKLKSEKSSTLKKEGLKTQNNSGQKVLNIKDCHINEIDQFQLSQKLIDQSQVSQAIVNAQIKQVRYWTTSQIPEIFIKILSCPISHYNMLPHSQRKVKEIDLKTDKFPEYLNFMKLLLQTQLPTYNHLLINHYPRGIGIMHHFDGPMYKDKVVVLSLGGPCVISFQENYKKESKSMQLLLEDKSIHVFEQDAYQKYLHGIQNNKVDVITFSVFEEGDECKNHDDMVILESKDAQKIYRVGQSSIKNFKTAKSIHKVIAKYAPRLAFGVISSEQERYCIDFDQFQGYSKIKGCFIYIRPDLQQQREPFVQTQHKSLSELHRWKMEIQRQQRISITIREQYSSQLMG